MCVLRERYGEKKQINNLDGFFFLFNRSNVTHVVTEYETVAQVLKVLKIAALPQHTNLLKVNWFIDSVKARGAVQIQDKHRIPQGDEQVSL